MFSILRCVIGIVFLVVVLVVLYAVYPWVLAFAAMAVAIHNFGR